MKEQSMLEYYRPGLMVAATIATRNQKENMFMGILTEERCPQCSAKLFRNQVRYEWCWNCDYDT